MSARRLSALDASFLRLESSSAHMHVGWSAILTVPDEDVRMTLGALRKRVAERLDDLGWCRWRLQRAPLGLSEPRWVEDGGFDVSDHVHALAGPGEPVTYERCGELRDGLLSEPLDRSRAPWHIYLIPRLEDGRLALLGKIHHFAGRRDRGVADRQPGAGRAARGQWCELLLVLFHQRRAKRF